jgi:hypothetical protein
LVIFDDTTGVFPDGSHDSFDAIVLVFLGAQGEHLFSIPTRQDRRRRMGQEKQSKDWHQPLRLEIALQTMLKALPQLEDAVIRKMKMVDAWGPILVRHGMGDAATKLTAALKERRTTAARQIADPTLTTLPQDPIHLQPTSDQTFSLQVAGASDFVGSRDITLADGHYGPRITHKAIFDLSFSDDPRYQYTESIEAYVTTLPYDLILGRIWLEDHEP